MVCEYTGRMTTRSLSDDARDLDRVARMTFGKAIDAYNAGDRVAGRVLVMDARVARMEAFVLRGEAVARRRLGL